MNGLSYIVPKQKNTLILFLKIGAARSKRYTKCYVFTEIKQFNTLPLSDPHTLNNLIIQKLKDASSKCDALNNKKMNSIIDTAVRLQ